ncbi:relaxase/mobilization nuclease domain-containing protein [Pedobacter glucosidilyticus]|uniref:relaxase/mobilization nuclease domain-containing protein n=1 Tax=Pedobacter glucosidilyticus TaxID=1122941 RepID=UPI0026EF990F|nr:relaxase/mobilization nuclease domain-containing protein [Pedobacter glucosidilyticus]
MVAKIVSGKSIRGILHYNENKVAVKEAKLILASGFATEVNEMSVNQKLHRFEHLTMLNRKVKTNAIHITLNFDTQDKLNDELLQRIISTYMNGIGFGDQPYLAYKHQDAAHPHVHIATTNIKADGKRIDIHGIGRTLSEVARKAIEKEFKLIQAEGRKQSNGLGIKAADIEKAIYGKTPTKRTITNIVNAVINNYKFTSLAEMNAVLKQFNMLADPGRENTMMFQKNGLMYSIINQKGEQVGVPIKASVIYGKPTLLNLEKKFEQNLEKRKVFKEPLKQAIKHVFQKYTSLSKSTFIAELAKQKISVTFRTNKQGFTYGITFVDNNNKTVFNGSDLGKAYSAKAIVDRLGTNDQLLKPEQKTYLKPTASNNYFKRERTGNSYLKAPEPTIYLKSLLDKSITDYGSSMSRKRKRKKKGQEPEQQQSF